MAVDRPHTPETPAADDPSPSQTSSMLQTSFYDVDENRKIVLEQLPQSAFAAGSASRSWKHRPPLPQTELYSRSLNDISSLMNKTRDREEDTHVGSETRRAISDSVGLTGGRARFCACAVASRSRSRRRRRRASRIDC